MTSATRSMETARIRALLVDRDADTRQMYGEFLKRSAFSIEEAEDGREALAKALTRPPDVIVTDTQLPGLSGVDLCQVLRQDAATRQIPILVVTGESVGSAIARARLAGADAVLIKPCLPERLAAELLRLTSSRRTPEGTRAAPSSPESSARVRELRPRSTASARRTVLSRAHLRGDTTTPPEPAPALVCPACAQPLKYLKSHVGGVSERHPEQWDDFKCVGGCGLFQYRHRTRKIRRLK